MFKINPSITIWLLAAVTVLNGCALSTIDSAYAPDINVSLGIAYLQQGNLEKARAALNQALSNQPRSPMSWGAMAYLEEVSGNLTLAASDYQHAIRINPNQGEGHNNYGIFLCRQGQPRAGIKELLLAAQLPSYIYRAKAYENAGLCALKIPDPTAAKKYLAIARKNGMDQGG